MKNIILLLIFWFFTTTLFSQITLEKSYASTYDGNISKQFGLVNLGNSNYKYYFINLTSYQITLYNLNHSVYKNITIPISGNIVVSYISSSLFDCDTSDIEYLVTPAYSSTAKYTRVYDENGTLLFNEFGTLSNACQPVCNTTVPMVSYPKELIFNTPNGTKMILSYNNDSTKVFSLCGTLTPVSVKEINNLNEHRILDAFPNPSSSSTTIQYELPNGVYKGEIDILNSLGQVLKTYQVDNQFTYITVPISSFATGTYFYRLKTSLGASETKKLIFLSH